MWSTRQVLSGLARKNYGSKKWISCSNNNGFFEKNPGSSMSWIVQPPLKRWKSSSTTAMLPPMGSINPNNLSHEELYQFSISKVREKNKKKKIVK
jgi:hypothetical protein